MMLIFKTHSDKEKNNKTKPGRGSEKQSNNVFRALQEDSCRLLYIMHLRKIKNYLGLGKSQSLDFDAQIADTTISMLQYNILSLAKRFLDYESMGEMFRRAGTETLELTIVEKRWGYLVELLSIISEIFEINMEEILDKIASDNHTITKIIKMKAALDVA